MIVDDGMVWKNMVEIRRRKNKKMGFHKFLMVMDAFKAHFTDDVATAMLISHTSVVKSLQDVHLKYSPYKYVSINPSNLY